MIIVSAGLIYLDGKVLITQRPPGKHGALKWEFPGGKVEEGEDPRHTLAREIAEELGIEVDVGRIVEVVFHRYADRSVLLLFFECRLVSGTPRPLECHDFRWTEPAGLEGFDFLDADRDFIHRLSSMDRD